MIEGKTLLAVNAIFLGKRGLLSGKDDWDAHDVAHLIKLFFEDNPVPLFPEALTPLYEKVESKPLTLCQVLIIL